MNVLKRYQELASRFEVIPERYKTDLTDAEVLELRTLLTIKNILTSQTEGSTMDKDVLLGLLKRLGWDASDFKKGKFHYEDAV